MGAIVNVVGGTAVALYRYVCWPSLFACSSDGEFSLRPNTIDKSRFVNSSRRKS
jgi:hypothetical protein